MTRDLARQNQHKKEIALLSEGKEREKRLVEYRKTAEDRKNYFESMERHMFASRTSIKVCSRCVLKNYLILMKIYIAACVMRFKKA